MAIWQDKFINVNKYARSGKKLKAVRKLVIHWTANYGASAMNHYKYFSNLSDRYASAHFFVDSKEALCIIPLNEMAYHANDVQKRVNGVAYRGVADLKPNANELSLGVEMCVEKDGSFHTNTISKTVEVMAELCKRYKLDPLTDIVRHYDVTAKSCPTPWVKDKSAFDSFKKRVKTAMSGSTSDSKTATEQVKVNPLPDPIGKAQVIVDVLNIRSNPEADARIVGKAIKDSSFPIYELKDGFYKLDNGKWFSSNSKYVKFTATPKKVEQVVTYQLIAGSFSDRDNADKLVLNLKSKKVDSFVKADKDSNGKTLYRVVAGSYKERANAEDAVKELKQKGFESFILANKK